MKVPPDVKEHFIDIWSDWITPLDLGEKFDAYENVRCGMRKSTPPYHQKKAFPIKQPPQNRKSHFQRGDKVKKEEPSEVVCYGCDTSGVINPKCPSCKGKDKRNHGPSVV
ncbi:hypothetical protein NPIL_306931 [Nephila pilipes]|uniref:Uncharacterized protein n=1 Tax=Nephila pilipes TaxID=299642 RepID=A0A8X6QRU4_NEPPI|nr:hypothetical protein NPIL_306931 [Nephila pilipes]